MKELEKTLAARVEELEEGQCAQTPLRSNIRTYVCTCIKYVLIL